MVQPIVYLDYNCFQRGFDDLLQVRIQLEATACQEIFYGAETGRWILVWSFMHLDETLLCPFPHRRMAALQLSIACKKQLGPSEKVKQIALGFQKVAKMSSKDALHVACASNIKATYFLSCDDQLLNQTRRLGLDMVALNPVDFIREVKQ